MVLKGVTGVVLAGGLATRMGGVDKGLQPLGGKTLVAHVLERLAPQVGRVLINANRNLPDYAAFGYPVVSDQVAGFAGPLAGLHAALLAAETPWVVTAPCDVPYLPTDLVARLMAAAEQAKAPVAIASAGGRVHPVFCLCRRDLVSDLADYLAVGERKVMLWVERHGCVPVPFDAMPEAFLNINSPDLLVQATVPGVSTP